VHGGAVGSRARGASRAVRVKHINKVIIVHGKAVKNTKAQDQTHIHTHTHARARAHIHTHAHANTAAPTAGRRAGVLAYVFKGRSKIQTTT
jgi:hypothetical protein